MGRAAGAGSLVAGFVPDQGDLVWLDFSPQTGHEQAGHRPALVISAKAYNRRSGLLLACPITSRIKGYPFEVPVKAGPIDGVVLADQLKSLDWRVRGAKFIVKAPAPACQAVLDYLQAIMLIG